MYKTNIYEKDIFMKLNYILYFITGILFAISAILNFTINSISMGIVYICLAITFTALGFSYKKKYNNHN